MADENTHGSGEQEPNADGLIRDDNFEGDAPGGGANDVITDEMLPSDEITDGDSTDEEVNEDDITDEDDIIDDEDNEAQRGPNLRNAYRRVQRDLKSRDESIGKMRERMAIIEHELIQARAQQNAHQEEPEDDGLGDDDDYLTVRDARKIIANQRKVGQTANQAQQTTQQQQFQSALNAIDRDGQKRWDDFDEVAAYTAAYIKNENPRFLQSVMNARDPARLVYQEGEELMKQAGVRRKKDATREKVARNANAPQSLSRAGKGGGISLQKMAEKAAAMTVDEYAAWASKNPKTAEKLLALNL